MALVDHYRLAKQVDNRQADVVVRHADADCFLFCLQQVGNDAAGLENKCVGTGEQALEQFEGEVAHLGVAGDLRKGRADEGERFFLVPLLDLIDPFDTLLAEDTAADSVGRVCRIGYDPPCSSTATTWAIRRLCGLSALTASSISDHRIQFQQVLMHKPAVLLDQNIVKPDLAVSLKQSDQIPVHRGTVAVVALVVALTGGEMDRAEDLLVKEDIAHGLADTGIDPRANSPM